MLKFLKSSSSAASSSSSSAAKEEPGQPRSPRVITSHNVNGLGARARDNLDELRDFFRRHKPCVHCVQECKLQSMPHPTSAGRYLQNKIWNGYRRGKTSKSVKEAYDNVQALLRCPELREYHVVWSLTRDEKKRSYAGTAVFYRKDLRDRPLVRRNLGDIMEASGVALDEEHGRILLLEFESMFVLNTYAPNNQTRPEGWQRRRAWDAKLKAWVSKIRCENVKPLVWVGDLNATTDDFDMSDPSFYRDGVYHTSRGWVDPTEDPNLDDLDKGQPGCSINEQLRLREIEKAGGLVDAYRLQHPPPTGALLSWSKEATTLSSSVQGGKEGNDDASKTGGLLQRELVKAGTEAFTWRGSPGVTTPHAGRYYGHGMRIDYTLISEALVPRVKRAEILGSGYDRQGFLGSDHAPILLELRAENDETLSDGIGTKRDASIASSSNGDGVCSKKRQRLSSNVGI